MKKKLALLLCLMILVTAAPAAAAQAQRVHPLGTSGTVTVGVRGTQMVYTTDGVNWKNGTLEGGAPTRLWWGFWNGTEFLAFADPWEIHPTLRSKDGVKWTAVPADTKEDFVYVPRGRVDVGKYRFELDETGELWLTLPGEWKAFQCQDVGAADRKRDIGFGDIQVYPVPGGVRVEAFSTDWTGLVIGEPYVTVYTTESLDWLLENRASFFSDAERTIDQTGNGTLRVAVRSIGGGGEYVACAPHDNDLWTEAKNPPWNGNRPGNISLMPYTGKTFLVMDNLSLRLYASEDGVNWRSLEDTFLAHDMEQYIYRGNGIYPTIDSTHRLVWTGSGYLACRRTAEGMYSMMGSSGGSDYSPYNTKVCFADENFNLTGEFDFGRQVERVGYANGVYYAEVSESAALGGRERNRVWNDQRHPAKMPTVIYKSADGEKWEATDLAQIIASLDSTGF